MRYLAFQKICNIEVKLYIEEKQWDGDYQKPKSWWAWYRNKTGPIEARIRDGNEFEVTVQRIKNKRSDWLLIQVVYGFKRSPTDLPNPTYRRPKVTLAPIPSNKPAVKRAFDDTEFPTMTALLKWSTTTGRMLADLEKEMKAEEGTHKGVITSIQVKWACKKPSYNNYNKFC